MSRLTREYRRTLGNKSRNFLTCRHLSEKNKCIGMTSLALSFEIMAMIFKLYSLGIKNIGTYIGIMYEITAVWKVMYLFMFGQITYLFGRIT